MTKYLLFISAIVFMGCNSEKKSDASNTAEFDFSYEVDTVMVDAGDHFIYLNSLLLSSEISKDGEYLYNFDPVDLALQIINLGTMKLENIMPLEEEGPNGIGTRRLNNIYPTVDGDLVLSDNYNISVIDKDGNKYLGFNYGNHDFQGEKLPESMHTTNSETLSMDGTTLITLYGDYQMDKSPEGLAIFDLRNKYFRYKPLSIFSELDTYRLKYYIDGRVAGIDYADIYFLLKKDSLIYSNSVSNKVSFYNLSTDSLNSKIFKSNYTTQQASGNSPNRADSQAEYIDIQSARDKEVNYGRMFFDEHNEVYWRFAKEMDHMKGDQIMYKTVLTAFDPAFNQLHEELLPLNFNLPYKYFARDGMIYTFLNIDDELAFVRIKPTFNYD